MCRFPIWIIEATSVLLLRFGGRSKPSMPGLTKPHAANFELFLGGFCVASASSAASLQTVHSSPEGGRSEERKREIFYFP